MMKLHTLKPAKGSIKLKKRIGRGQYGRVLRLARKPTADEFVKSSWVVGIGIGIVGAIGFIVYYVWLKAPPIVADLLGI